MHRLVVQYVGARDVDAFVAAYRERHVPLVRAVTGVERFVLTRPRGHDAPSLVAELWFADGDTLREALGSPAMAAATADAATYDVERVVSFTGAVEEL